MSLPLLSALEARVLGVLVEKQHTVPDTYPLSLNSLVSGCNQKTSRDPVMDATDAQVQEALDRLRSLSLAIESSGSRVMRYAHNAGKVLGIPEESVALVATLLLRGPQTPGEIRINCERLHRFADISSVQAYLEQLARREGGAMVVELARVPGSRETRWMHLLCGAPAAATVAPGSHAPAPEVAIGHGDDRKPGAALEARVDALEREVDELKRLLADLSAARADRA